MNVILLDRTLFVFLFSEALVWFIFFVVFLLSLELLFRWNFNKFDQLQYKLEKRAYLVATVVIIIFIFKMILLPFFVFTIDKLSSIVPGAMCGAGVISFNNYGMPLLFVKLSILFLLIFWLTLNNNDLKEGTYPYFKAKIWLFVVIFLMITLELALEYQFFKAIDIHKVINCCSTLYGLLEGMNPLPFGLDMTRLLTLFYLLYLLILSSYFSQKNILLFFALILFLYLGYFAVLYFFGTYIYQDPNHNCPFCLLQKEYYYIGYLIWGNLFLGVFIGIVALINEIVFHKKSNYLKKFMLIMITLFVLLCSAYVGIYYFNNGVFLESVDDGGMAGMMM